MPSFIMENVSFILCFELQNSPCIIRLRLLVFRVAVRPVSVSGLPYGQILVFIRLAVSLLTVMFLNFMLNYCQ
jgi:hypothetical protein